MRVLVLWVPDWPVAVGLRGRDLPGHVAAAVLHANRVVACNEAAREVGVRRGMRRRDAQSRCPELVVLDSSPDREAHGFEEVLGVLEALRPGVAPLRPGLVALRSPGRFYGGDEEAAAVLAEAVVGLGLRDVRIGVADDLFTAEQAARSVGLQESLVVPSGGSGEFLRPLSVTVLEDGDTVSLLQRLGLMTLADLAAIPAAGVAARFGRQAAWVHRVLTGRAEEGLASRKVPPDLTVEVAFEPPLVDAEAVAFSTRRTAEEFVTRLAHHQLVCTDVTIEISDAAADQVVSSRRWLHPRWFGAADLIDRLHWQMVGALRVGGKTGGKTGGSGSSAGIGAPVTRVRFVPEAVVSESVHADGLWGGSDARVERGIARVQGLLGPDAVLAPVLQGGRTPAERQAMVPWGVRPTGLRPRELPWPGTIPPPYPARVLTAPVPAGVMDAGGRPVVLGSRGAVSAEPTRFRPHTGEAWLPVSAWAGPWPVDDAWWETGPEQSRRKVARFQIVAADGRAWLLTCDGDHWVTEASYD